MNVRFPDSDTLPFWGESVVTNTRILVIYIKLPISKPRNLTFPSKIKIGSRKNGLNMGLWEIESKYEPTFAWKSRISLTFSVLYRSFTSVFKTAAPLLRGQSAGGCVESAMKTIAFHSLSPSFSAMKTQRLALSPCSSSHRSRWPKWLWFPHGQ